MKSSAIHMLLSALLLFTYGAERLLPCSGIWDIDCGDEHGNVSVTAEEVIESSVETTLQQRPTSLQQTDNDHSDHSDSHDDHQCSCPCHAVAISSDSPILDLITDLSSLHGQITLALLHTTLSPPEPVPIG